MRVRVAYTTTVDNFFRRAIRFHRGEPGLATRAEIQAYFEQNGSQGDDDLTFELQTAIDRGEEPEVS